MIIDLNGTLKENHEVCIDPDDRGFTLGDGVFETLRIKGGVVRRLEAHLRRPCSVLATACPQRLQRW